VDTIDSKLDSIVTSQQTTASTASTVSTASTASIEPFQNEL
tara:strand:+ start:293 stop:415 length:123 start_codon:yes stop_codon:yes gene_type:complete